MYYEEETSTPSPTSVSEPLPKRRIKLALIALAVLGYGYILFLGDNSLGVLLSLQDRHEALRSDTERLRNENAALQKQYFELQAITEQR